MKKIYSLFCYSNCYFRSSHLVCYPLKQLAVVKDMGEKTTIDRNVIDKTAGSGLFQIRTIFLLCLVSCIGGSVVLCSVFLLYTPPHRCTVPEVDWINGTPPATIFTVSSK